MLKNIKLVSNHDGTYDIVIEYENNHAELSMEPDTVKNIKTNSQKIMSFIKSNAQKVKISSVRIVMAGVLITTLAFSSFMSVFASNNKYTMGYLYSGTDEQHIEYVTRTNGSLNTVSPSYFDIEEDGSLKLNYLSENLINTMHSQGIKVVPFLSNHWNRTAGINALENIESLSTQIANYIEEYNLDGVNVDIENVTHEQRDRYTEFVKLLREKIPSNKEVSVAVAANPNGWQTGWHGSYDYAELSKYADHLLIMAYDEHHEGSSSGPVSSINFVENSIKYALSKAPADKIVIGIPLYGRVWSLDNDRIVGKGISIQTINEILKNCESTVTYDESSQSVKAEFEIKENDAKYTVGGDFVLSPGKYEVWYENDKSYSLKLNLISKYNIKGAGAWSLGQEDPSIWNNYASWINGSSTENTPSSPETNTPEASIPETTTPGTSSPETTPEITTPETSKPEDNDSQLSPPLENDTQNSSTSSGTSQQYIIHEVKPGDTLWKIAQKYLGSGNRYTEIKALNNLTSDIIYPGMKFKIPSSQNIEESIPETSSSDRYIVKKGDTLWKIAQNHLGSGSRYAEIKQANGLVGDIIYPGQILKLPNK